MKRPSRSERLKAAAMIVLACFMAGPLYVLVRCSMGLVEMAGTV